MNGSEKLERVDHLISWWISKIKVKNAFCFFDINRIAEGVALKLLNEIYDYHLENLNYEKNNYPGIDLGDKINKIGFQITSQKDPGEILDKLEKFTKGPHDIYSQGIRFLILSQEKKPQLSKEKYQKIYPGFDPEKHILNVNDLIKEILKLYDSDPKKFHRTKDILETEIAGKAMKRENVSEEVLRRIRDFISCYPHTELFVRPEVDFGSNKSSIGKKNDVIKILGDTERAIIIGEIGLGKTTLCCKYAAEKEKLKKFHFVLVVPLKNYKSISTVSHMICETIDRMGVKIDEIDLENLLKDKARWSFVFDGFNEFSQENRHSFVQAIARFCDFYPEHQVVVTCRSEYYNNEFRNFTQVRLLPWGEYQVKEYLKQAVESEEIIDEFLSRSKLNNEQRFLLSRPFFLTQLVDEYKKKGEFPENRKILLDCIVRRRLRESVTDEKSTGLYVDVKCCLSKIAFEMQKNFSMAIKIENAREQIHKWFSDRGKRNGCGYSFDDLWGAFLKTGFMQYDEQQISFIHETWQDFFTAQYLERTVTEENSEVLELASDSWWNDAFLFMFNYIPEEKIKDILDKARMKGNLKLVGFALRREAGINANQAAQSLVTSLMDSGNLANREKIYETMKYAVDTPWCIKTLLDCIDEEQNLFLKEMGESFFDKLPLTYDIPGCRAYYTLTFGRNSFFSPLPTDALEEILDVKDRTPLARLASTEILTCAIGVIKDSTLIDILEERAKDLRFRVREAVIDVIEQFWWRRGERLKQNSPMYIRIVSILKSLKMANSHIMLIRMGSLDHSDWVEEQCDSVLVKVESAISQQDPELGYRMVSMQFEDILGDPYCMAFQMLSEHEKKQLLRLTIDHIIRNRERLEDYKRKLDKIKPMDISDIERRAQLLNEVPELLWSYFSFVVRELGIVANNDDIWRFKELLTNTPLIWGGLSSFGSNKIELAWNAAEALERIGGDEAQNVLKAFLCRGDEITVVAALALVLGELHEKWKVSSDDFFNCRNSVKKMMHCEFFSIFFSLNRFHWISAEIYESFFLKFGKEKIREMVRQSLETDTESALKFLEFFGLFRHPEDLKRVLNNPSKVEYHERIKELLKKCIHSKSISL
jgi:hypothetical protein